MHLSLKSNKLSLSLLRTHGTWRQRVNSGFMSTCAVLSYSELLTMVLGRFHRGFKTIYIRRPYTDVKGVPPELLSKFDLVIEDGGIEELARRLGAL